MKSPNSANKKGDRKLTPLFEQVFSVSDEDIQFTLEFSEPIPWENLLLNPRRLRGSDFLMRWSQGQWSEERLIDAVIETGEFTALRYGISSVAPEDPREAELYFEFLDQANVGKAKRPDILIFPSESEKKIRSLLEKLSATIPARAASWLAREEAASKFFESLPPEQRLPFFEESHPILQELLEEAVLGVEAENSLWKTELMPGFREELRPMRRLGGKPGLPKSTVTPTIILKEEDRAPLLKWEEAAGIPIHIWHVFFDKAFGVSLDNAVKLIEEGYIEPRHQTYQSPGGATTKKTIYNIYHHYAYPLAKSIEEPTLEAAYIIDRNGHILPYVRFSGGKIQLTREALEILRSLSSSKARR